MRRWTTTCLAILLTGFCIECGRRIQTLTGPTDTTVDVRAIMLDAPPGGGEGAPASDSDVVAVPSTPAVFAGAGDIAICGNSGDAATARLLDAIGGTFFALGDNAYYSGSTQEYTDCYDRTWGRHRSQTRPAPGNHEYESPGAAPYFDYFGVNAGPRGLGYYSFELGGWHVVALNSNVAVSEGSPQGTWLRADLAANRARCTLAYWHHPRFSSGKHGNQEQMRGFWHILYEAGAEVILSAHDHIYERFAAQDPDGVPDPSKGIRQFVVGTGGANPYSVAAVQANSEVRLSTIGVLKLTLTATGYDWEFISVGGPGDSGTGTCH